MKKVALVITLITVMSLNVGCTGKDDPENKRTDPDNPDSPPTLVSKFNTYGLIIDTNGNPVSGVPVSDGFTTVTTNEIGKYEFDRNSEARFVYYSTPAHYEVNIAASNQLPSFHQRLRANIARYDFTIKPLNKLEKKFNLICIGDPQIKNSTQLSRFTNETIVDIKAHISTLSDPNYAITLGDISWDSYALNENIAVAMKAMKVNAPVFQTIGNHDHETTISNDWLAKATYEETFGPTYYSFNRGDVHIISVDDVLYTGDGAHGNGFTKEIYQWIKDDLSYVPKSKMVILCLHVPIRGQTGGYFKEVVDMLSDYAEVHVMSAHSHTNLNYTSTIKGKLIYEHTHGTTCGAWWNSTINCDGTPNGYAVYQIEGASIKNWYYKATGHPQTFQIRMHRASEVFTGGTTSAWRFTKNNENQIIANVWNCDKSWNIEVFEDDVRKGTMTNYSDYDVWAVAYHMGALRGSTTFYKSSNHMYYYTISNPSAVVTVKATDSFGNTYSQTEFTSSHMKDYPMVY